MSAKPFIAAFDVATVTGVCLGRVGTKPITGVIDLKTAGTSRPRRFLHFSEQLQRLFAKYPVDQVVFEAPLNIRIMMKIGSSDDVITTLRGLIGILEAEAARAGIEQIAPFNLHEARKSLTGYRTFPKSAGKSTAKAEIMRAVKLLGIDAKTTDAADACCGWLHCCALSNPRIAVQMTPLFRAVAQR